MTEFDNGYRPTKQTVNLLISDRKVPMGKTYGDFI